MLVLNWCFKSPKRRIIIQTEKVNLLIAIYCAISEIKLSLSIIARILTIPDRTSMPRVAAIVLPIGVVLVDCVEFTFCSCAEIVVVIVAKFVIIWQVTKVYSTILLRDFHITGQLSLQLKNFVVFLGVQSLWRRYFLVFKIELRACRMRVAGNWFAHLCGCHAQGRSSWFYFNGILGPALSHDHLLAGHSSRRGVLCRLKVGLLVKVLFLHSILTLRNLINDGNIAHSLIFALLLLSVASLAKCIPDALALFGFLWR